MTRSPAVPRRFILIGLLVGITLVATVMLRDVLATVFFAITVAAVARPLYRALVDRGLSPWWASLVTTAMAILGMVAVFTPVAIALYLRRAEMIALVREIPETIPISLLGFEYVVDVSQLLVAAVELLRGLAVDIATLAPVLVIKLALFTMVVFALLIRGGQARRALLALVPSAYEDVVTSLERRAKGTLYAIYVVQAVTALATFLLALPVFWLLGYEAAVSLAIVAATLQFLPVVGPTVLIAGLAAYELVIGDVVGAILVIVIGGLVVASLPDVVLRPRLAREATNLPGSVYFVGFVGGLLSLGPIGVIAGPLVVALLVEAVDVLARDVHSSRERSDVGGSVVAVDSTADPSRSTLESSASTDRVSDSSEDPSTPPL